MPTVNLDKVSKFYGKVKVLNDITHSFSLGAHIIRGKNGSGKSTLLKVIAGIAALNSGTVSFPGWSANPTISFFSNDTGLYPKLTVQENLLFFSQLLDASSSSADSVIECWNLQTYRNKQIHELSAGVRARVGIARTFIGSPEILLFDEPSAFLDQEAIELFQKAIQLVDSKTRLTLIATHDFERLDALNTTTFELKEGNVWKI